MDAESLKEIGIETIGQRLAILKAVYQLKLAQQIPIDSDDYVPPCMYSYCVQCVLYSLCQSRSGREAGPPGWG